VNKLPLQPRLVTSVIEISGIVPVHIVPVFVLITFLSAGQKKWQSNSSPAQHPSTQSELGLLWFVAFPTTRQTEMRCWSLAISLLTVSTGAAFAPPKWGQPKQPPRGGAPLHVSVEAGATSAAAVVPPVLVVAVAAAATSNTAAAPLSGAEIKVLMEKQLDKLRAKDAKSPVLSKAVRVFL
jgi:hypothetical protein